MSRRLTLFALFVGALFLTASSATRAGTPTFSFSFADSPEQYILYDGGEAYSTFSFTIIGGSGNVGLTPGTAKTIHVGSSYLYSDANDDGVSAAGTISRTVTIGGITQTLTQNDNLGQSSNATFTTVDVQAGPTLTFDEGTQGRVDVTPLEYSYDTRSGAAPKYAYTLLLRPAAVPVSGVSVSPGSVTYPASATGTVTLAKPAPDAETVILTSSNPAAASVPASLTFTAGQQTLTFPITTFRVDTNTVVTLSAAAGGTTKSTSFTVKTRPETAFTYSIPDFPNTTYTDSSSGTEYYYGLTGGSGTVKLAQSIPLTVTAGTYFHDYSFDSDAYSVYSNIGPIPFARTISVNGATRTFSQFFSGSAYLDDFDDQSFSAGVTNSNTIVYDYGAKGRLQVTASGYSYYTNNSGRYSFSPTSPAQYTFLLLPPNPAASLLVSPGKVYGGATTYGKITLSNAAETGGQTVTLQTSDPSLASVPASVVVPAGVKSAVFPVTTGTADEDTPITLTATSGGTSKTATLTVLARYGFSGTVKSGTAGLGGVTVGASSTGTFTLTSTTAPAASIPDNSTAGLSSALKPKGTGTIFGLVVGVDITHSRIGDLRVTLKGPDGTSAVLYDQSGGAQQNILASYPVLRTPVNSLSVFNGKQVAGTWTLLVQDLATGNVGTLNAWNLTFTYQGTVTGSGTTASDGTYTVPELKEGTYTATPARGGTTFTPSSRSVTVGPNVVDPNPTGVDFARK